jgi:opacity protein-like surface antigen
MGRLIKHFPVLLLAVVFAATLAVAAQPDLSIAGTQASTQSASEKLARGELMKVDTENMTLTIKDKSGTEWVFQYNDATKVEGSSNGIQGLSTETGTQLAIHYVEKSDQKVATKIEIVKQTLNR